MSYELESPFEVTEFGSEGFHFAAVFLLGGCEGFGDGVVDGGDGKGVACIFVCLASVRVDGAGRCFGRGRRQRWELFEVAVEIDDNRYGCSAFPSAFG